MRPQDCRILLPVDILQIIEGYVGIEGIINLAIALRIDLSLNDQPIFTNDYMTFITDSIDEYIPITRTFRPKVSGSVLIHHIERQNNDILLHLCEHCVTYFDSRQIIATIKTHNFDTLAIIMKFGNREDCFEYGPIFNALLETDAFDMTNDLVKHFSIGEHDIKRIIKRMIDKCAPCRGIIRISDHFGIPIVEDKLITNHISLWVTIKDVPLVDPDIMIAAVKNCQLPNEDIIDTIKCVFDNIKPRISKKKFRNVIKIIFHNLACRGYDACLWMIDKYNIPPIFGAYPTTFNLFKELHERGFDPLWSSSTRANTIEDQKWIETTFPSKKHDFHYMIGLIGDCSDDVFIYMFTHKWSQVEIESFFGHGSARIVDFLVEQGYKVINKSRVYYHQASKSDFDGLKCIYELFPYPVVYSLMPHMGVEKFKWVCDTFPMTKSEKNDMARRCFPADVELLAWFLRKFPQALLDVTSATQLSREMQDFVDNYCCQKLICLT